MKHCHYIQVPEIRDEITPSKDRLVVLDEDKTLAKSWIVVQDGDNTPSKSRVGKASELLKLESYKRWPISQEDAKLAVQIAARGSTTQEDDMDIA